MAETDEDCWGDGGFFRSTLDFGRRRADTPPGVVMPFDVMDDLACLRTGMVDAVQEEGARSRVSIYPRQTQEHNVLPTYNCSAQMVLDDQLCELDSKQAVDPSTRKEEKSVAHPYPRLCHLGPSDTSNHDCHPSDQGL